jgi:AcrR family transcriptional regulator
MNGVSEEVKMSSTKVPAGRPRSDASRAALINTTYEMLRELGYERLSIEAIAARSGVSRTTVYRWYPTKEDLVIEALIAFSSRDQEMPNRGDLVSDMTGVIEYVLAHDPISLNRESCALTLSALSGSPHLAQTYWDLYIARKRYDLREIFERAKRRGEIAKDSDLELFLDLFHGYLLFGLLVRPKGTVSIDAIKTALHRLIRGFHP